MQILINRYPSFQCESVAAQNPALYREVNPCKQVDSIATVVVGVGGLNWAYDLFVLPIDLANGLAIDAQ
jgi:hypothetical protein